ncbi:glycosyltransferase family 8 protein [Favolaschia claudopus]|uniref:Glycosyltransferase family 8 protein n=1 Tax=Favolaschia claudopus TaxID=2862362 RepID=A0AAV9ZQI2_9AGAR
MQPTSSPQNNDYEFTATQDWFTFNISIWQPFLVQLRSDIDHAPRALEIGSWEGRSAVYLLDNFCNTHNSELICIDHFDLHRTADGRERYEKMQHNLSLPGFPFRIIDEFSTVGLYRLLEEEIEAPKGGFDFVYVDGSHEADDTFLDAELAWRLTRQGAILIFDDYEWNAEPVESIHHPHRGIDAFLLLHRGEFDVLHKGYQVIIRKTAEMRIGFLTKKGDRATDIYHDAPINIAFCTDSGYAMPTAVALTSSILVTAQRMSVYIIDCGLTAQDRERLQDCVASQTRVTLSFISLPPNSRARKDAAWAKIEALSHLPVERVVFLDSDILVRHDLGELWKTDLGGKTLAAARDVGLPMGHSGIPRQAYFNAGVLLIDMKRIRTRLDSFMDFVEQRSETAYKDQDALNEFFHDEFREISVQWNATGLGTYATMKSSDRDSLWPNGELEALNQNAKIVHFAGPTHPSMSRVLDEYNQPWASKPWGFAGAPGHPFAVDWFRMLGETAWKDWFVSDEFKEGVEKAETDVIEQGIQIFRERIWLNQSIREPTGKAVRNMVAISKRGLMAVVSLPPPLGVGLKKIEPKVDQ